MKSKSSSASVPLSSNPHVKGPLLINRRKAGLSRGPLGANNRVNMLIIVYLSDLHSITRLHVEQNDSAILRPHYNELIVR